MVADTFAVAEWEGISLSHKGFDTRIGSRFDAELLDHLNRLTTQSAEVAVPSAPVLPITQELASAGSQAAPTRARPGTVGSLRRPQVVPVMTKALQVSREGRVVRGLKVRVPPSSPAYRQIDLALTPARPLTPRYFAGGLDWHAIQKTEE